MKILYTILMGLLLPLGVLAQNEEALTKIQNAKIAMITERLNLSSEQAERFWPIYNEYSTRQREIRQEYTNVRQQVGDPQNATEEQNKRLLELALRVKDNQLQLEREYTDRMLRVINNRQMVNLRKAEEDFRKMLIERMQRNKMAQQRRQQIQNQRNQRRN